ncbi:MAG: hypothetical protein WBM00_10890 [Solirubrobacterales bacterium]
MARSLKEAFSKAGIAPPPGQPDVAEDAAPRTAPSERRGQGTEKVKAGPGLTAEKKASAPIPKAPLPHRGRIEIDEIEPGIVVQLDPAVLIASTHVINTQDPPVTRAGLFVCVESDDRVSTWAGMTTGKRRERLELKPEWRRGGRQQWRQGEQFLTDGASLWHGDNRAFVAASWQEISYAISRNRARLSEEGLAAVRKEVEAQRPRRHRSWEE